MAFPQRLMWRCFFFGFVVASLWACLALSQAQAPYVPKREWKILASLDRVPGPLVIPEKAQLVIRSAEELAAHSEFAADAKKLAVQAKLTQSLAKSLGVEKIDWTKHMALAVSGGRQPYNDRVNIHSLTQRDHTLLVAWKQTPGRGAVFSHSFAVVLTERFEGPVQFVIEDEVPFQTISQGSYAGAFLTPEHHFLRNEKDWINLWDRISKNAGDAGLGQRPKVDFTRHHIVAVFRGKTRRIQASIHIHRVDHYASDLVIWFAEKDRGGADESANAPFHIVTVPAHHGDLLFEKTPESKMRKSLPILAAASSNQMDNAKLGSLVIPDRAQLVIRSSKELADYCDPRLSDSKDPTPSQLTDELVRRLNMKSIDWKTQMLIAVSAGRQGNVADINVTRLSIADKTLRIDWLVRDSGDTALSYPRQVILTQRFDGPVEFAPNAPWLPFRTLVQGPYAAGFEKLEHIVIKTENDWENLVDRLRKGMNDAPIIPKMDFAKECVVAIFRGKTREIQAGIEILQAENRGDAVHVFYRELGKGGHDEPPVNRPYHIVAIPKVSEKIVFHRIDWSPKKKDKKQSSAVPLRLHLTARQDSYELDEAVPEAASVSSKYHVFSSIFGHSRKALRLRTPSWGAI